MLLLKNVSYDDRFGWTLPPGTKRSTAIQAMQQQAASAQASNDPTRLPADLIQQLGPGYNGTLPVLYINSVWLCPQPNMECTAQPAFAAQRACLLQAYTKVNPDVVGQQSGGGGASYGVSVVLPAVLGSVGEWKSAMNRLKYQHVMWKLHVSAFEHPLQRVKLALRTCCFQAEDFFGFPEVPEGFMLIVCVILQVMRCCCC